MARQSRAAKFPTATTMILHGRHVLLLQLTFTSAVLLPPPYPHIASTTTPSHPDSCLNLPPTPPPDLRRRQDDPLGWDDPLTCNLGVCASGQYCTVFSPGTARASLVIGACCPVGQICSSHSECLHYTSHTVSNITIAVYSSGTMLCGASWPTCSTQFIRYGYGQGTLEEVNCWGGGGGADVYTTTYTNPSWRQYATETSPAKGPMPTTTWATTSRESSTSHESSTTSASSSGLILLVSTAPQKPTSSGKGKNIPIGAIAGIAIGCIVLVVVGVVVIMAFRSKFRKAEREGIMRMQNKEMDPQSPVPWHTPQQQQAYPEQQQQALQGGATLEAQTGARIDTSTPVWQGGRQ